jgi:integrase
MLKKNLYKGRNGYIYYRKTIQGRCIQLPAHTKSEAIANKLHSALEYQVLNECFNPTGKNRYLTFRKLINEYLAYDHMWTPNSRDMTTRALYYFITKGIPENQNSAAIIRGRVNNCINWGLKNNIKTDQDKFTSLIKSIPRNRVFDDAEMYLILNRMQSEDFREFVKFAYYTGARRGELVDLKVHQFKPLYFETTGKTGERLVRLNRQAREVLSNKEGMWDYKEDYITHHFKKELRRLEIVNGRFHDLRRTFGYNLIVKKNVPIYKVSKLLGHALLSTTERHYAPLLVVDVEEFELP